MCNCVFIVGINPFSWKCLQCGDRKRPKAATDGQKYQSKFVFSDLKRRKKPLFIVLFESWKPPRAPFLACPQRLSAGLRVGFPVFLLGSAGGNDLAKSGRHRPDLLMERLLGNIQRRRNIPAGFFLPAASDHV